MILKLDIDEIFEKFTELENELQELKARHSKQGLFDKIKGVFKR